MALRHAEESHVADALVEELAAAELLLVATLRLFAARCRDPAGNHPDWRNGFRAAAIAECAIPAFSALFNIISGAALRPLDVRCPHCRFLGEDEAHFLRLEGLLQGSQTGAAAAILAGWLTDSAARMAMLPAQGLANAMMRGGLIVPIRNRRPEAQQRDRLASVCTDPGLALLQ
jgi:hypothetical protein